ncbi:MAG: EamA family transporter [Chloroflexota bacterium]
MPVNWFTTALLSAALLGAVNIFDSHLITRRMPSLRAYMLPISLLALCLGVIFLFLFPMPAGLGAGTLALAITSAIIRSASAYLLLVALKREEVSRVIPVASTFPIFVALAAVPLLGETITGLKWFAITIVVAGAVMVSLRERPGRNLARLSPAFFQLIGSSLLMAAANVTSKDVLDRLSFWNLYAITVLCMGAMFLIISARPAVLRELAAMPRKASSLALVMANNLMVVAAMVAFFWSLEHGPASLVSTITSSRPVFVFVYAFLISRFSPSFLEWQYGRRMLALRLLAITMICGGIIIIYLP